jgi:cytochrome c oxidase subunit 4
MSEKVTPLTTYWAVFVALIALTVLTVGLSFLNLGSWHLAVGVTIGCVKAVLVALFFMHLIHSTKLARLVVIAALFWLAILMSLTLSDYLTRQWGVY